MGAEIEIKLEAAEAQAILNALRDSGALSGQLVFDHVVSLEAKVRAAMHRAGHVSL